MKKIVGISGGKRFYSYGIAFARGRNFPLAIRRGWWDKSVAMPRLKSRTQNPPGGFIFSIPQAGVRENQSWSFNEAVDKYLAIARANPRLRLPQDRATVENLIDEQNASRVGLIQGGQIYLAQGGVAPPFITPPPAVAKLAGAINKAQLLKDMMESDPVGIALAGQRASVCVQCPMNRKADWKAILAAPAFALVRAMMAAKSVEGVTTQYDEKLETCSACDCPLAVKILYPIEMIKKHTTPEQLAKFHPSCWIRSELNA